MNVKSSEYTDDMIQVTPLLVLMRGLGALS